MVATFSPRRGTLAVAAASSRSGRLGSAPPRTAKRDRAVTSRALSFSPNAAYAMRSFLGGEAAPCSRRSASLQHRPAERSVACTRMLQRSSRTERLQGGSQRRWYESDTATEPLHHWRGPRRALTLARAEVALCPRGPARRRSDARGAAGAGGRCSASCRGRAAVIGVRRLAPRRTAGFRRRRAGRAWQRPPYRVLGRRQRVARRRCHPREFGSRG